MFCQLSEDLCINVSNKYSIPQKDNSFINLFGKNIDIGSNAILAMTNIDMSRITKFELPNLLSLIIAVRKTFPNFTVSADIQRCINRYIDDIFSQSFWLRLSNSVDCGFEKMDRRKFPYFHCADKMWKSINTIAVKNENTYPTEMNGEECKDKMVTSTSTERKGAWDEIEQTAIDLIRKITIDDKTIIEKVHTAVTYRPLEKNAESRDSNYYAFDLLEPQFYPNLNEYDSFMTLLYNAGLMNMVVKLLYILPLTYECCHVIKTAWYWRFWNDLIFDESLKNYVIYYSMYILKHEENKAFSSVPLNARFIFTIPEARLVCSQLPSIGIDKHSLIHLMEPLGYKSAYMPFFLEGIRTINSLDEFKNRLSIATNGLLDGIDLSEFQAVLSGSILVPCIATNPLEDRFKKVNRSILPNDLFDSIISGEVRDDKPFQEYLEVYYPSYDSVKDEELHNYFEPVQSNEQYEAQKDEDLNSLTRDYPNDIDHAVAYDILSDLDISIHSDTFEEFKVNVYKLFEVLRRRAGGQIYMRRIRRAKNYKYSIYGPGLKRPIDLFWITKSPATFVEQFHLGVVRSYWDGKNVYISQSALAALLTGINHDYRWLSSNKAPAIPVLKYAQRGYTTPLNRFERSVFIEYMTAKANWTDVYKSQGIDDQIYGPVGVSHIFFMPDKTQSGIRYGLKPIQINQIKKINNEKLKWNPLSCATQGIPLEYYNTSRNSIGLPTIELIDKFLTKYKC